jgi:predicted TIM-barrel fold metal-dependent hydrolase
MDDLGPIVDSNVHLWDQSLNEVFWLSDRSMLRSMLGDYDSLPDRYTLGDYRQATTGYAVNGSSVVGCRCGRSARGDRMGPHAE